MASDPRSVWVPLRQQQSHFRLFIGAKNYEIIEAAETMNQTTLLEKMQGGRIVLSEEEVEIVSMYLSFYRTGSIPCQLLQAHKNYEAHAREYEILAKLFCFGERHKDITFKNRIVDAIWSKAFEKDDKGQKWPPTMEAVTIIVESTEPTSRIRAMLVEILRGCNENQVRRLVPDGRTARTVAFLLEVVAKLSHDVETCDKSKGKRDFAQPKAEQYHEAL